eukprot:1195855-Pyramimonas_sp.AAC.1
MVPPLASQAPPQRVPRQPPPPPGPPTPPKPVAQPSGGGQGPGATAKKFPPDIQNPWRPSLRPPDPPIPAGAASQNIQQRLPRLRRRARRT